MKLDLSKLQKYADTGVLIAVSCQTDEELIALLSVTVTPDLFELSFRANVLNACRMKYFEKGLIPAISGTVDDIGAFCWDGYCYDDWYRRAGWEIVDCADLIVPDDPGETEPAPDLEGLDELWEGF